MYYTVHTIYQVEIIMICAPYKLSPKRQYNKILCTCHMQVEKLHSVLKIIMFE